jgi:CheY-like chemotaxis protein
MPDKRPDKRVVLLVEDEALIRMDAADVLGELGFAVEEAATAQEAVAALARAPEKIGAVIVDIGLPDGRGDDLAAELRSNYPDIAVIIASGNAGESARRRFAGDALVAFADKPYRIDTLAAILRKLRSDL